MTTREYLLQRWAKTLVDIRIPEGLSKSFIQEIFTNYDQPGRHYHTTEHLKACFETLDSLFGSVPLSVELALWYHDIFYDPHRSDNEDMSARYVWARLFPFIWSSVVNEAMDLIRMTQHHAPVDTRNGKIVLDVDLSILGETPEKFDRYEVGIRAEYAWVEEEAFRVARSAILQRFLTRSPIYLTPEFQTSSYELQAKANLTRSLATYAHLV